MIFGRIVGMAMMLAFAGGAGFAYVGQRPSTTEISAPTRIANGVGFNPYKRCSVGVRHHCVVDGDTIWSDGVKIRVADIDTPEVGDPKCPAEAALGAKATNRLLQLVNAGPFEMRSFQGRDEDRYGRKLRVLIRNGQSLGDILVREGLARTWTGRREPWC
jgi:micrococcal nuclease